MRLVLLIILVCASPLCAHSGRTDSQGGHFNRSTGEYHFHDGRYAGRQKTTSTTKSEKSGGSGWFILVMIVLVALWFANTGKPASLPTQNLSSGSIETQSPNVAPPSDQYYLSSTGVRHNRSCKYFRRGRSCSANAGRRCRLCGG